MLTFVLCATLSMAYGKPPAQLVNGGKGACDQTMECAEKQFTGSDGAVCSGYFGCFKAIFETTENINCIGSASCFKASFTGGTSDVARCLGYRACEAAYNLEAKTSVTCAGAFACQKTKQIKAKKILCDGDVACSNYNLGNTAHLKSVKLTAENTVHCNGKAVCQDNKISAGSRVQCDGDGACRLATISADLVWCDGKRVCQNSKVLTTELDAFGFYGVADATVKYPTDMLLQADESTQPQFVIRAYGFNSLVGTEVFTRGAYTKISGLGYRSLYMAVIYCESTKCDIVCANSACKGATVYYNARSDITMDPPECDLNNNKKKVQGVHCPTFTFSKVAGPAEVAIPRTGEMLEEYEMAMAELEEFNQIEDEALDQYMAEIVDPTSTMDNLEQFDLDDIEQAERAQDTQNSVLFASQGSVTSATSAMTNAFSSLMVSNFITAGLVVLLFVAATCYSNVNKDEIKKLNPASYQTYN